MSLIRSAAANGEATSISSAAHQSRMETLVRMSVRRVSGVEETREPTHAVGTVDDALSGITDVRIRDLVGGDGIVGRDVGAADHSRDAYEFIPLVEFQGFFALD